MTLKYVNELLRVENVKIKNLVDEFATPFYIYSYKAIEDNYINLRNSLKNNIFYSMKANSNQAIIRLLSQLGAGIDVVSGEELQRAISAKINPKKIIFEGVGKTHQDIKLAITKGIRQINIESINEIEIINDTARSLNLKINAGIRINPNIDAKSSDKISTGRKEDKFGVNLNDLQDVIKKINNCKNINFIGISCHIGSQIFSLNVFEKLFKKMLEVEKLFRDNKLLVKHLDLGGGMGFDYNKKKKLKLDQLSKIIDKYFSKVDYEISFEPGRLIVANSGVLVTKILMTKKSGEINFLVVDAGMNTFIRPALYQDKHNIIPLKKGISNISYSVVGPVCESSDTFINNIKLTKQKIGDILVIEDVGAYGSVMASNYNSKVLPAEIMVKDEKYHLIRKPQNIEDIILKDSIPNFI